ncbi:c-type cytochrome [Marinospirillum alkaliphilum]|uniref:Cytochrome c553 n=1 Tax=Marinospirillum alkaliphilum DSM 21637 TaxID=1122209 RepID=A0A1K1Y3M8_9GAMM|nr:c-type cytochrome [Marinospirillum alkaliphilum]SFX56495.1 Cytochrome c553 [Marinospirillum alkaliphilum DSM 21637]
MKTPRKTLLMMSLLLSMPLFAGIEGDAERGRTAAAVCAACHQADGSGMHIPGGESWPRLAAMDAGYMYRQLVDFREGRRTNASMMPFAAMLTDQQLKDVSVYYSQLPATPGQGGKDAAADLLKLGQRLVEQGDWERYIVPCGSCHGPASQGAGSNFPGIAGQHAGYIERQLLDWKQGKRDNDPQHLMLAIAERMTEQDIRAVAAWLSTLPAQ